MNFQKKILKFKNFNNFFFLLFLYSFSIFFKFAFSQMNSYDFWWHMKTGEFIVTNKLIPLKDPFSWYGLSKNLDWTAHEWLSEIVFYSIFSNFSYFGMSIWMLICLSLVFVIAFYKYSDYFKRHPLESIFLSVVFTIIISAFSNFRPFIFSYILFLLMLQSIDSFINSNNNKIIFLLPIISLFWVNLHGGSSGLIYMIPFFAILLNSFDFKFAKIYAFKLSSSKIKLFSASYFLSLIFACFNPYGYKMILYPFSNLNDSLMLNSITEWASPNFHDPTGLVVLLGLVAIIFPILVSEKKISLYELFLFSSFFYLSLKMVRMTPYFILANISIYFKCMPKLNYNFRHLYIKLFVVFFIILNLAISSTEIYKTIRNPIQRESFPYDSLNVLYQYKPQRMLNAYNYGGFYIYHLFDDDIKVFIDGRADIFTKYNFEDYSKIVSLDDSYLNLINKYQFDCAVFRKDAPILKLLQKESNWIKVSEGDVSIVLINTNYLEVYDE